VIPVAFVENAVSCFSLSVVEGCDPVVLNHASTPLSMKIYFSRFFDVSFCVHEMTNINFRLQFTALQPKN